MIYAFIEMISFLNCNFKTINKNCYFTNQNRQNWLKLVSIIILIHMLIKFMTVESQTRLDQNFFRNFKVFRSNAKIKFFVSILMSSSYKSPVKKIPVCLGILLDRIH